MKVIKNCLLMTLAIGMILFWPVNYAGADCVEISSVDTPLPPMVLVDNGFQHGTTKADAISLLPQIITLTLDDGTTVGDVPVSWIIETIGKEWEESTAGGYFTAEGTLVLPSTPEICPLSEPLSVTVAMKPADRFTFDWEGFDQPGQYISETILVNGEDRTYHFYVPSSYDGSKMPLLLDLHGGGSYGIGEMSNSRSDRVAEREGFITVCPDNYLSYPSGGSITDFVSAIIDKIAVDWNIDTRRVYAIGISMGGIGSSVFAYHLTNRIAAFGIVSSRYWYYPLPLSRPMTFVNFHGLTDPLNVDVDPYVAHEFFREQNGCPLSTEITDYIPPEGDDPTYVNISAYSGGLYGTEVVLYAHTGGHVWPGGRQYAPFSSIGLCTYRFSATEVFWDIVKKHAIPEEVVIDIKPGSCPNSINLNSKGVIAVALFSTPEFDATAVDVQTVQFGPARVAPVHYSMEDVDNDGLSDMVFHFRTQQTGIEAGDESAMLQGRSFFGTDSIRAFYNKKK